MQKSKWESNLTPADRERRQDGCFDLIRPGRLLVSLMVPPNPTPRRSPCAAWTSVQVGM